MARTNNLLTSSLLCLAATACSHSQKVDWSEFATLDPDGWDPVMAVEFCPQPTDSLAGWPHQCDVVAVVRYRISSPQQRLTLQITEENADGDTLAHTTRTLPLFQDGNPAGRAAYAVCEVRDTLHRAWQIPEGYRITVGLPPGTPPPAGMLDLGFAIGRTGATASVPALSCPL